MSNNENRKFNRIQFKTQGYIRLDGKDYPFTLINISLKGILLHNDNAIFQTGKTYDLRIKLLSSNVEIKTSATLIHIEGNEKGFFFKKIDLDSMIHLRRLLELNGTDDKEMEKEFSFLKNYSADKP